MMSRILFILAHQINEINFYPTYAKVVKNQWKSYDELKEEQEKHLRVMIDFAYNNTAYYHKLFDDLNLNPDDIKKIDDLEKLPILTKETIKKNWETFKPINLNKIKYYENATGGSTGTPFKYRLCKLDRFLGGALLYRGWGYAGFELGDKMAFLAGSSLDISTKSDLEKRVHEIVRNIKKFSSYDMGKKEMQDYANIIKAFKPKFIRGYASSIYFFAEWIKENNIDIYHPDAVFTTAEKLQLNMREKIRNIFNCDVYDAYGLNDGGVSAYECPEHSGLHIDTERSIMEVADKDGNQVEQGEGKILATSLFNYAMPFIRYDTGDLGHIINDVCECGRGHKLLKEIIGRQREVLQTPEGKYIHGGFFTRIFWEIDGIKEFQVIQEKLNKIVIKIVPEDDFDERQLEKIREIIRRRTAGWILEFKLVDTIELTRAGKYNFIINEVSHV